MQFKNVHSEISQFLILLRLFKPYSRIGTALPDFNDCRMTMYTIKQKDMARAGTLHFFLLT